MPDKSSYLRYLPPVLWEKEPPAPAFSLGTMLRVFEKILTGLDDGEGISHGTHEHEALETVISRLHHLFDPWATPAEFLDWLASWVSLRFSPLWDEYQRRKVTAEIVQIYQRRGLKEGLDRYLDLYTVAATRPRIVVDDGSRILSTRPQTGRFAAVATLISQGPFVRIKDRLATGVLSHEGLVRPQCLALAPEGSLLVGDAGTPTYWSPDIKEGVWRILPPGRYEYGGSPPKPRRVGPSPWIVANPAAPVFPLALVVDDQVPWRLYVLDGVVLNAQTALYRLPSPGFAPVTQVATKGQLGLLNPVAMALDINGHLLILDRGDGFGTPNPPRVIDVDVLGGTPPPVTPHNLTVVQAPLSFVVLPNGDMIVGDARDQNPTGPADLVYVDRTTNPATWAESPRLAGLPANQNPLVAPTAVVRAGEGRLYVLDAGLKPFAPPSGSPYIRELAESAAVYLVDLSTTSPTVVRATETRRLVYPRGMVREGERLYICDAGEPEVAAPKPRVWRALPSEFGVIVHFSNQRPTTDLDRQRIVGSIREIVEREKPAHALWTVVSAI